MKSAFFLFSLSLLASLRGYEKIVLNFRTYLTPSIPIELYECIVHYVNQTTPLHIQLSCESRHSGPPKGAIDPFTTGEIDLGHLCSPPYLWLAAQENPAIELFPLVPRFIDQRTNGRPVYFSDVIVAADSSLTTFAQLRGKSWCYNDCESLSGYFCMLQKLASMQETTSFFSQMHESGSHLTSLQWVAEGKVAGSAIDSNVLALQLKKHPELKEKIRILESWGPFPLQPLVIRKGLDTNSKRILIEALQRMAVEKKEELATFLVDGFGVISENDFTYEEKLLATCSVALQP